MGTSAHQRERVGWLHAPPLTSHQSSLSFAATLRRVADYGRRAARTRLLLLVLAAIVLTRVPAPPVAWATVALAALGSYLSWATNGAVVAQRPPLEPLARWSSSITEDGLGRFRPDAPGLLEAVSYVPLACLGPWILRDQAEDVRLVLLALALLWIASCVSAIFLDPAFYRPGGVPSYALAGRAVVGPVAGVLACAVVGWAPWSPDARVLALGMAASLALTQLRIRETDRLLSAAAEYVGVERVDARKDLIVHAHNLMGTRITALGTRLQPDRHAPAMGDLWDLFRDVRVGYSTFLTFDIAGDVDIEWPGLLEGDLQRIRGRTGMHVDLTIPDERLLADDRRIAHYLLDDLASNAANSGASRCRLTLWRDGALWRVVAEDDGDPINPSAWMREGGDLARMVHVLGRTGDGDLRAVSMTAPKRVEAHWRAADEDEGRS